MTTDASVTGHYTKGILQAAKTIGLNPPEDVEIQQDSDGRVSQEQQSRLWKWLQVQTDDPLFGLYIGKNIEPKELDLVDHLLANTQDFGDALRAIARFYPVVTEGSDFVVTKTEHDVCLSYTPCYDEVKSQRVEALFMSMIKIGRWVTNNQLKIVRIAFAHEALSDQKDYEEILGCPVQFQQTGNEMHFSHQSLQLPIQQFGSTQETSTTTPSGKPKPLSGLNIKLRAEKIIEQNPSWNKEQVAKELNMSGRHLNRKLAEENFNFKKLHDQIRLALAEHYLITANSRLADIANALGFNDESALIKAFKRWTGMTPKQFREKKKAEVQQA